MLKIIKVTGESLSPFFLSGDFVLILRKSILYSKFNPGDVVVFSDPNHGLLIKEIQSINQAEQTLDVKGTHPFSVNSDMIGSVPFNNVIGKVIWHIKKPVHFTS
jgi:signal peptidase I